MPQAADILSDPEINQAYEDVRSDKSETTWLVLKVCGRLTSGFSTKNDERYMHDFIEYGRISEDG